MITGIWDIVYLLIGMLYFSVVFKRDVQLLQHAGRFPEIIILFLAVVVLWPLFVVLAIFQNIFRR